MIKIIRILFDMYVYIVKLFYNEDTINEDTINEDTINEDTINEDTINEDNINIDYKNEDNIDNTYRQRYNNNYKKFISSDNNPKHKKIQHSQSTIIEFQHCGWCNAYIDTTFQITYLYMDKIYCNIKCRNNQIEKDKGNNNPQMTYNYSI